MPNLRESLMLMSAMFCLAIIAALIFTLSIAALVGTHAYDAHTDRVFNEGLNQPVMRECVR